MKPLLQKRFVFIAKSMLWSVLLYAALMLAFNWDDVSNRIKGANPVTVMSNTTSPQAPSVNNPLVIPANISHHISLLQNIIMLAKDISGIVGITTGNDLK